MQKAAPRLLIAGTNSGCGKTTVTCAILQALGRRRRFCRRGEVRPRLHRPHVPPRDHRRGGL